MNYFLEGVVFPILVLVAMILGREKVKEWVNGGRSDLSVRPASSRFPGTSPTGSADEVVRPVRRLHHPRLRVDQTPATDGLDRSRVASLRRDVLLLQLPLCGVCWLRVEERLREMENACWLDSRKCEGDLVGVAFVETPTKLFAYVCQLHKKEIVGGELIEIK